MSSTRINPQAYIALSEALAVTTWYKRAFESLLRTHLPNSPEILAQLDFNSTKREIASALVQILSSNEAHFREVTLDLMLNLASMSQFPDIESLSEPERAQRLNAATAAISQLYTLTREYSASAAKRDEIQAEQRAAKIQHLKLKYFESKLEELKLSFLDLSNSQDRQRRGYKLEELLFNLFSLYDLEPHLAYALKNEQIDGSISFNASDYIVEAKWTAQPVSHAQAEAFAAKIRRKGRNTQGILVSINGLSRAALDEFQKESPFIEIDGSSLYNVLEALRRWGCRRVLRLV
ncbi:MAG: restriction endonuclease [Galactobacter sp.]